MTDRIDKFGLRVARPLHDMIENEALPQTGVASDTFWKGLSDLVHDFGPKNQALLAKRDDLQAQIDAWHRVHRGQPIDTAAYKDFLTRALDAGLTRDTPDVSLSVRIPPTY